MSRNRRSEKGDSFTTVVVSSTTADSFPLTTSPLKVVVIAFHARAGETVCLVTNSLFSQLQPVTNLFLEE